MQLWRQELAQAAPSCDPIVLAEAQEREEEMEYRAFSHLELKCSLKRLDSKTSFLCFTLTTKINLTKFNFMIV